MISIMKKVMGTQEHVYTTVTILKEIIKKIKNYIKNIRGPIIKVKL